MPMCPSLTRSAGRCGSLRLSVTDRCNLRCHYCMPEDDYLWLPREDLLTFEEIAHLADLFGAPAWTASGSPVASRCSAATCPRSSHGWPSGRGFATSR